MSLKVSNRRPGGFSVPFRNGIDHRGGGNEPTLHEEFIFFRHFIFSVFMMDFCRKPVADYPKCEEEHGIYN